MTPNARQNLHWARKLWNGVSPLALEGLSNLSEVYAFSVILGDLLYLNGGWYVTHVGLMRLAQRKACSGIEVRPVRGFCDVCSSRWVFKATVFKSSGSKGFTGYGDADPSNVSPLLRGAEMRIAETRAVNRALRKAYGIGICSVEELGSSPFNSANGDSTGRHSNGYCTRLRDRLCQLIRQHGLDAELVKAYAVDFCGTKTLREAKREQVEKFVAHLADWAARDRDALLSKLKSLAPQQRGAA